MLIFLLIIVLVLALAAAPGWRARNDPATLAVILVIVIGMLLIAGSGHLWWHWY